MPDDNTSTTDDAQTPDPTNAVDSTTDNDNPGGSVDDANTGSDPSDNSGDDGDEVMTVANARKLRAENASLRKRQKEAEAAAEAARDDAVKAALAEAQKSADDRITEQSMNIARLLGFEFEGDGENGSDAKDSDDKTPATPAVDTEALIREALEAAEKKNQTVVNQHLRAARDAQVDALLYRNAADLEVDPVAVSDSRAFQAAIDKLDYAADDFAEQVKAAATAAVEANPKLRATPEGPSRSSGGPGGNGTGDQTPSDDIEAMRAATRKRMLRGRKD